MIACVFDPGPCITGLATGAADAVLSLFPFGTLGIAFTVGLIIGAIIGKWGVGALIALVIAVKFGSQQQHEPSEHFDRHPDPVPQPHPRPVERRKWRTIADALRDTFERK